VSKTLLILNDPPYGTERSYNVLRLAGALAEGTHRSTLEQLTDWTEWADEVVVF
jgi:sulfur relay (sulfurtransferase) complex TusBCD TusD component (DsrE family)